MYAAADHHDVIILGAGAAGLMCAITAARRGRRVLVLEKANKAGKKILMSGGGRCNFTNYSVTADNYLSHNPHFCKSALSRYTQWHFIAMVEEHGIEYEERKHGQLFCRHSAKDILAMLLTECDAAGVSIETHCEINTITALDVGTGCGGPAEADRPARYALTVTGNHGSMPRQCDSLVVATGALSIPTLGGSGLGYEVARQFDLPLRERRAGLVPFMFSDDTRNLCERLSGVALPVEVSCNDLSFSENLLFTHRGISGPAILQISNYWQPGDQLDINLLPDLDAAAWLCRSRQEQGSVRLRTLLHTRLPRALISELQLRWWPNQAEASLAQLSQGQLIAIGKHFNQWQLKPSATEGYRTAEVTLGGVDTASISSKTMEARQHPGLFFIGEVLDVTGQLGGFNFQWAWSSGFCAGMFV